MDLHATVTGLSLFDAAIAPCEQLHRKVPWMLRKKSRRSQLADRLIPPFQSGRKPS